MGTIITLLIGIGAALFFLWFFFINIYEVKVAHGNLKLSKDSEIACLEIIPLNSLGGKALFRKIEADFKIVKGEELVEIINGKCTPGVFTFSTKGDTGEVRIRIDSNLSFMAEIIDYSIE